MLLSTISILFVQEHFFFSLACCHHIASVWQNNETPTNDRNILVLVFIGPESNHWQCLSLTDWLTDWLTPVKWTWWLWMIPTAWWCRNSYWKLWKAFLGSKKLCKLSATVRYSYLTLDSWQKCYQKVVGNILNQNFLVVDTDTYQSPDSPHMGK